MVKNIGKKSPENRRSEENSGSHLPDYAWLANPLKDPTDYSRHEQYGAKGDDQLIKIHGFVSCRATAVREVAGHASLREFSYMA